ncbi:NUDIX hydrolase [Georgenia faecalis]|uniref:NUDIX hydrolase n=1 Tax=Georgenia faecalis TaxID=2483799 RepID=UPI0024078D17|nr:NUDIX hydrolase [Georgenia faecalis]
MSRATPPAVQAAGALVWRVHERRLQVLLVHRPRYDDWSWPKGKLDPGETLAACAVREVAEETGVAVALGQPLPSVRYRLADGRVKESHYWTATVVEDGAPALAARPAVQPADPREIDAARWVDAKEARTLLTHDRDRDPLGVLLDLHQDERLRTRTIVVVRHARARKRSAWKGGELTRPLTGVGEARARALVPLLAAFGVEQVISSPWERCVSTVVPYAQAAGIDVGLDPALTEDAHAKKPKGVRAIVDREVAERAAPVAICTHRPVLPTVMDEIAKRTPYRIMEMVPESDPWLRTGEVLVVHVARRPGRGAAVVALEKHRPPVPGR